MNSPNIKSPTNYKSIGLFINIKCSQYEIFYICRYIRP